LGKYSGIFLVKKKEYSEKAALFFCVFPETLKALTLGKIFLYSNFAPVTKPILIPPETLSTDTLSCRIDVLGLFKPISRSARIEVFIVIGLEREPSTNSFLRVSEFDALFKY